MALIHSVGVNHDFLDGNTRTAINLAELLLEHSGYRLDAPDRALSVKVVGVAYGRWGYEDLKECLLQ